MTDSPYDIAFEATAQRLTKSWIKRFDDVSKNPYKDSLVEISSASIVLKSVFIINDDVDVYDELLWRVNELVREWKKENG